MPGGGLLVQLLCCRSFDMPGERKRVKTLKKDADTKMKGLSCVSTYRARQQLQLLLGCKVVCRVALAPVPARRPCLIAALLWNMVAK